MNENVKINILGRSDCRDQIESHSIANFSKKTGQTLDCPINLVNLGH